MATFLGTVTNNVVNVPLAQISGEYHASLAEGVLVVSGFVVVLASVMPVMGWVSDRFGRRRVLSTALLLLCLGLLAAGTAPSLPALIAARVVQGLACAAIAPAVMGTLPALYPPELRARAMSSWAAANGLGQAVGPPLGGVLAGLLGWPWVFFVLAPLALVTAAGTARLAPPDRGRSSALHWPGAVALTLGAALLMTSFTAAGENGVASGWIAAMSLAGVGLLAVFVRVSRAAEAPLIPPTLLVETRFLRSSGAAFVQMAALVSVLVAVPLYAATRLRLSTPQTGLLIFALPAAMVAGARPVGRLADRIGARRVMRGGLALLAASQACLAAFMWAGASSLPLLAAILVVVGAGVASVQTPSAAGVTRSPSGQSGASLGLFNMIRFAGAAAGAAWVAATFPSRSYLLLFLGSGTLVLGGLVLTYLGPDPGGSPGDEPAAEGVEQLRPA